MDLNSQFFSKYPSYLEPGNTIITDGWSGYNFLDEMAEYTHDKHIHGGGDFGFGLNSTSHIEIILGK